MDLGIEPYLVSSSLLAVLAQRLERKVCADCAENRPPTVEEIQFLQFGSPGPPPESVVVSCGCEKCRNIGFRGRVGVFELLMVDDPVRVKSQDRSNASVILP